MLRLIGAPGGLGARKVACKHCGKRGGNVQNGLNRLRRRCYVDHDRQFWKTSNKERGRGSDHHHSRPKIALRSKIAIMAAATYELNVSVSRDDPITRLPAEAGTMLE